MITSLRYLIRKDSALSSAPKSNNMQAPFISASMSFTALKQALKEAGVPDELLFNANGKPALIAIAQARGLLSASDPSAVPPSSASMASNVASHRLARSNERSEMQQRRSTPAVGKPPSLTEETPVDIASTAWLRSIGVLEALAEALAPLLDSVTSASDKAERLREPKPVQEAIAGSVQKLAGLICDAASREAEKHRAAQGFSPDTIKDTPTRALFESALGRQAQEGKHDAFAGAKHLYSRDGLAPWQWGVSKDQFSRWIDSVRAAHDAGKITNQPDSTKPFYYPQDLFDSREVGPNMHQVNRDVIKPMSAAAHGPLPGVSTALGFNLSTGGVSAAHIADSPDATHSDTAPPATPNAHMSLLVLCGAHLYSAAALRCLLFARLERRRV